MSRKLVRLDGDAIRRRLRALGQDQAWLTERSGECKSLVSKVLNTGQATSAEKAENIAAALGLTVEQLQAGAPEVWLDGLPPPLSEHWVGRETELRTLDSAWTNSGVHVVSIIARCGSGKTSLVRRWLAQLASEDYRGARAVFAWSFNQAPTATSNFLAHALRFLGSSPPAGEADQVRQLLSLLKGRRTLLILDGLDAFQEPSGSLLGGALVNPALRCLLTNLAADNPARGLCVLTARQPVRDLADFKATGLVRRINLAPLTDREGTALLDAQGVRGSTANRAEIVRAFDGHCLTLTVLGGYLALRRNGDPKAWCDTRLLDADDRTGSHIGALGCFFRGASRQIEEETRSLFPDPGWCGRLLGWAGLVQLGSGRLREASALWETAYRLFEAAGDPIGMTSAAGQLALVSAQRGEIGLGLGYATRAIELAEGPAAERKWVSYCAFISGRLLHLAGHAGEALRLFGRYEDELLEDIRYPAVVVTLSVHYCKLLLDSPLCEVRRRAAKVAARLPATSVTPVIQCYIRARAEADPSPAAAMLLDEALDGFRQYGLADNLVHALLARSSLSRQRRDWPRAEADVREAFQVATTAALRLREMDVRLEEVRLLATRARSARIRQEALDKLVVVEQAIKATGYGRRRVEAAGLRETLTRMR